MHTMSACGNMKKGLDEWTEAVEETAEKVIKSARAIAEGNGLNREERAVLLDNMLDKALQDKYYYIQENKDVLESKEYEKSMETVEKVQETEEEVQEVEEEEETEEVVQDNTDEEEETEEEEEEEPKTFKSLDDLLQERIE